MCVVAFPPVLNQFQVKARVSVSIFLWSLIFHQVFFLVQWVFTSLCIKSYMKTFVKYSSKWRVKGHAFPTQFCTICPRWWKFIHTCTHAGIYQILQNNTYNTYSYNVWYILILFMITNWLARIKIQNWPASIKSSKLVF